jgi:hypothetical protein
MEPCRIRGGNCRPPFPVYEQLVDALLSAHTPAAATRDAIVAHVLDTCAGYAYSDIETVATSGLRYGRRVALVGFACALACRCH